jgi:hypothetical protein
MLVGPIFAARFASILRRGATILMMASEKWAPEQYPSSLGSQEVGDV